MKTQELTDGYVLNTEELITPEAVRNSSAKLLPRHTVLMAMYGATVGQLGILGTSATCNQACCAMIVDPELTDYRYLYYQLLSHREQIKGLSTGAAQQNLSGAQIKQFLLPFPELREQERIADTLSALDTKITLLRETNATLEAIAQAIFKSWFVDFDPVRAKAEGCAERIGQPSSPIPGCDLPIPEGVPPEVADLFPSEFEDSELGAIPKGWRVGTLGEISTNVRSQARPDEFSDEMAYIGLEHMPRKSIALGEWEGASKVDSAKSRFKQGQILFGKLRPYFHKVGIAPLDGVCSTDILVIEPKTQAHRSLCVCHFSSTRVVDYATQLSNGAKMPRTSWQDLARFGIAVPPKQLASAFNEIAEPLFGRVVENIHQARALSELRDTLLPRLMSGKLRILA